MNLVIHISTSPAMKEPDVSELQRYNLHTSALCVVSTCRNAFTVSHKYVWMFPSCYDVVQKVAVTECFHEQVSSIVLVSPLQSCSGAFIPKLPVRICCASDLRRLCLCGESKTFSQEENVPEDCVLFIYLDITLQWKKQKTASRLTVYKYV